MYSRFRRYGRRSGGSRYTSEVMAGRINIDTGAQWARSLIVGSTNIQGVRKVKNFQICIPEFPEDYGVWALVYVPEGLTFTDIHLPTTDNAVSIYEPNQNIIMAGRTSPQAQTVRSRLARNLGSGDAIYFGIKLGSGAAGDIATQVIVSYAIKFG